MEITIKEALNKAHHHLMAADDTVVVIGEDVESGVFGVTAGLHETYGAARVINTPISETSFVGMSVGAAATGLKPIVEIMFCDFMGVCFDQVLNQAAKMRFLSGDKVSLPLVIRMTMGAGDGSGAMHSQSLHGILLQISGLVVACPSTPADAAGLLKSALSCPDPVVLLEHKGLYDSAGFVQENLPATPLGRGRVVREGKDITVVALSGMIEPCMAAAKQMAEEGIQIEIIDPRTIRPLDVDMISVSVRKTGRLLVADEGPADGGFADSVVAEIASRDFAVLKSAPAKVVPVNTPVPYAPELENDWLPSESDIMQKVRQVLSLKERS